MKTGVKNISENKMTLTEQREKLIELLVEAIVKQWPAHHVLAAISAAGFSIVGPEVTDMLHPRAFYGVDEIKAMLAAGDIARKPE
jgi:Fe2+ or Zn2+ uptake regulation protein